LVAAVTTWALLLIWLLTMHNAVYIRRHFSLEQFLEKYGKVQLHGPYLVPPIVLACGEWQKLFASWPDDTEGSSQT
jgi:hypothetical protein